MRFILFLIPAAISEDLLSPRLKLYVSKSYPEVNLGPLLLRANAYIRDSNLRPCEVLFVDMNEAFERNPVEITSLVMSLGFTTTCRKTGTDTSYNCMAFKESLLELRALPYQLVMVKYYIFSSWEVATYQHLGHKLLMDIAVGHTPRPSDIDRPVPNFTYRRGVLTFSCWKNFNNLLFKRLDAEPHQCATAEELQCKMLSARTISKLFYKLDIRFKCNQTDLVIPVTTAGAQSAALGRKSPYKQMVTFHTLLKSRPVWSCYGLYVMKPRNVRTLLWAFEPQLWIALIVLVISLNLLISFSERRSFFYHTVSTFLSFVTVTETQYETRRHASFIISLLLIFLVQVFTGNLFRNVVTSEFLDSRSPAEVKSRQFFSPYREVSSSIMLAELVRKKAYCVEAGDVLLRLGIPLHRETLSQSDINVFGQWDLLTLNEIGLRIDVKTSDQTIFFAAFPSPFDKSETVTQLREHGLWAAREVSVDSELRRLITERDMLLGLVKIPTKAALRKQSYQVDEDEVGNFDWISYQSIVPYFTLITSLIGFVIWFEVFLGVINRWEDEPWYWLTR